MHIFKETLFFKMLPALHSEADVLHTALLKYLPDHELNEKLKDARSKRNIAVFGQSKVTAEAKDYTSAIYVRRNNFEIPLADAPLLIDALGYLTSEEVFLDEIEVIDTMPDRTERTIVREDFISEQELAIKMMNNLREIRRQTER